MYMLVYVHVHSKDFLKQSNYLTINFDLIVLQLLSSFIRSHTGISTSILLFSIEDLQSSPTCQSNGGK